MRMPRVRFATLVILLLSLAAEVGCGRAPSRPALDAAAASAAPGPLDEAQVLAIARRAVASNFDWVDQAEFDPPRRDGSGWSVFVWSLPKRPGGHVMILIDETGKVTDTLLGS